MNTIKVLAAVALALAFAPAAFALDSRAPVDVVLKTPATSAEDASGVAAEVIGRSVRIDVHDGRGSAGSAIIGQGTNDDDLTFPIRTGSDIRGFVDTTARQAASGWGLRTGGEDGTLDIRFVRFNVEESNKAVGSMFVADVKLAYTLTGRTGKPLAEGAVAGQARRYGRARSGENCSEVLGDALNDALTNLLNETDVRTAWAKRETATAAPTTAPDSAASGPGKTASAKGGVEQRLRKLQDLRDRKVISGDEYDQRRAAILKEL